MVGHLPINYKNVKNSEVAYFLITPTTMHIVENKILWESLYNLSTRKIK